MRYARTSWVLVGVSLAAVAAAAFAIGFEVNQQQRETNAHANTLTHGHVDSGRALISERGCGGCHDIPGVIAARGKVGPPLKGFAGRMYIGGVMRNTPDNLIKWLQDPPAVDDKTAMPNVGLKEQEARDVAAYLYTLD